MIRTLSTALLLHPGDRLILAQPIYPGITPYDNTALDPGLTLEMDGSTGDSTSWDDPRTNDRQDVQTVLDPGNGLEVRPRNQKGDA